MRTSDDIKDLAAALSKAQGEIQNVVKDAKNPHFKSDYATLDAITDTVRPVFAKHGLAVVQIPAFTDGIVTVETLITHNSGQWIAGISGSPIQKADPQGVGSATTYLRRYSLAGLAAIAQTDDDGNAASGNGRAAQKAAPLPEPKGYGDWLKKLDAASKKGTKALRDVYMPEDCKAFRLYLNATNTQTWEDLKTVASDADKAPAHV